jgi:hypothetical protein
MLDGLGGNSLVQVNGLGSNTQKNEIKPTNLAIEKQCNSDEAMGSIQIINETFLATMKMSYPNKFESFVKIVEHIGKNTGLVEKDRALKVLEDKVYHLPGENVFKQFILEYTADVRKVMRPLNKNESIKQDVDNNSVLSL